MLNENQIKGNWNEIKGGVRNLWGRISDEELERVKGNLQEVVSIVQEKYNESKETISEKMKRLMDSFDNETDKTFDANTRTSYERNPTGIRSSGTSQYQDESLDGSTRSAERSAFEKLHTHGDSVEVNTREPEMGDGFSDASYSGPKKSAVPSGPNADSTILSGDDPVLSNLSNSGPGASFSTQETSGRTGKKPG